MVDTQLDMTKTTPRCWRTVVTLTLVGFLGLAIGVPQFMAGFHLGPQDDTMRALAAGRKVMPEILKSTEGSRNAALGWVARGRPLGDLAVLRLTSAIGMPVFSPERRRLVADGISFQISALTLGPADGYGWTRLAQAQAQAARTAPEIEKTLGMALDRAPNIPGVVLARLAVSLLYWRGLSPALRRRLVSQMRLAALWFPTDLARLARARLRESAVRDALANDPRLAGRFEYALSQLIQSRR